MFPDLSLGSEALPHTVDSSSPLAAFPPPCQPLMFVCSNSDWFDQTAATQEDNPERTTFEDRQQ